MSYLQLDGNDLNDGAVKLSKYVGHEAIQMMLDGASGGDGDGGLRRSGKQHKHVIELHNLALGDRDEDEAPAQASTEGCNNGATKAVLATVQATPFLRSGWIVGHVHGYVLSFHGNECTAAYVSECILTCAATAQGCRQLQMTSS